MIRDIKRPKRQIHAATAVSQCSNDCASIDDRMAKINVKVGVRREQFSNHLK